MERWRSFGAAYLPGLLGIEVIEVERGMVRAELEVRPELEAPNGYLHGGSVVALADTCCGYGSAASLPEGATGFTTVELKCNFVGTATEGRISCRAELVHDGRTTQLWKAEVTRLDDSKPIAHFTCTQMVLYG
jgi:uncharacterized protein (TIGR00369 family)